ncbi:MAG: lipopolysaccharide transport periplasmic protein LptA [Pseudomonadota bacterium]
MTYRNNTLALTLLFALVLSPAAPALESDRQQPLEVSADDGDGYFGDGISVLEGRVEIRQGTLHIRANRAEVEKTDGKVRTIRLLGAPARLEQEIEEQGLVQAEAERITYEVGAGLVRLTGAADVNHPQYRISGESLTYDLDRQHFEGTGAQATDDDSDGRIRIRLEPEVAADFQARDGEIGSTVNEAQPADRAGDPVDGGGNDAVTRGSENGETESERSPDDTADGTGTDDQGGEDDAGEGSG